MTPPEGHPWTDCVHFPDPYPIDVFLLSFNFLCLLLLSGIYLGGGDSASGYHAHRHKSFLP
jgi:hypothetical protein